MGTRRTAVVKLRVSDEQRDALHATNEQFLWCANQAADYCWNKYDRDECVTVKRDAQAALYDDLRAEANLTANLVILAIYRAVEAVKGCVARWKKRQRVSKPRFESWVIDYDKRSSTIHRRQASLPTVDGRVVCDYELPRSSPTPYERYVLGDGFDLRTSTLRHDETTDDFYLHVSTRGYDTDGDNTEGPTDTGHQTVLGIDFGVNSLAVASTGTFWRGDDYDHWIAEFEKRRATLQQRGTQAAHNTVLRLGKRERA